MAVRDGHSSRIWPGCMLSGCGPKLVRFFLPVVSNAARVSRGYHKKWLCAIGIPAASGRGVRFLGADQNLSAFFCRSSEMLLASLVAITRNRSEEHTSELQSQSNLVCRLLLENKKA